MPTVTASPGGSDSKSLALLLRRAIQEGQFAPNDPFPSLRTLVRQYGAGFRVARTATDLLVKEGFLVRRERSGTFVRPFPLQPSLPGERSKLRCVTVIERPSGTVPGFVRMDYMQGYTQVLDAHPIRMRAMNLPDTLSRLETVFSDQYPFSEQGCILINLVDAPIFRWLIELGIVFVVQNFKQYPRDLLPPHLSVVVNKTGGAFKAVSRLIELGHRRIGYAGLPRGDEWTANEVYGGYAEALRCAGLEERPRDLMHFTTDDAEAAYPLALPLMKDRELPTAIVAQTDSVAIGIIQAARTLGIRVPEDLSVAGFNDQAQAALSVPPLTTVAVPRVELGRAAAEILLASAAGSGMESATKVLECHLVERGSTGPVAGGG